MPFVEVVRTFATGVAIDLYLTQILGQSCAEMLLLHAVFLTSLSESQVTSSEGPTSTDLSTLRRLMVGEVVALEPTANNN